MRSGWTDRGNKHLKLEQLEDTGDAECVALWIQARATCEGNGIRTISVDLVSVFGS